jgi:hypothetical protein
MLLHITIQVQAPWELCGCLKSPLDNVERGQTKVGLDFLIVWFLQSSLHILDVTVNHVIEKIVVAKFGLFSINESQLSNVTVLIISEIIKRVANKVVIIILHVAPIIVIIINDVI